MWLRERQILRHWLRLFKLTGWQVDIRVQTEKQNKKLRDCEAYLSTNHPRYEARVTLNEGFPQMFRKNICHEALHLLVREHFYPLLALLDDDQMRIYGITEEQLIHRLTHALCVLESEVTRLKEE